MSDAQLAQQLGQVVEEVQRLVAGSTAVRALGTRHSFNPIADSADLLLSTSNLDFAPHIQEHERLEHETELFQTIR